MRSLLNFRILFLVAALALLLGVQAPKIQAAAGDVPLRGYAWSDNVGWLSFSCENNGYCANKGGVDYGVFIGADGSLFGYAWSDNIGWVSFNTSDLTGCLSGTTCEARYNSGSGTLSGWARALAYQDPEKGGWDGWISLSDTRASPKYGVTVNASTGEFGNYAWSDMVMGWLSFNCANTGTCGASDYKVYALFPGVTPPGGTMTANGSTGIVYITPGTSATIAWTLPSGAVVTPSSSPTSAAWNGTTITVPTGSTTVSPTVTTTYTITGTSPSGPVSASVTVVPGTSGSGTMTANGSTGIVYITPGTSATIAWTLPSGAVVTPSSSPTSAAWNGTTITVPTGSTTVSPTVTTTYTITGTSPSGPVSASVTVVLSAAGSAPVAPTISAIAGNLQNVINVGTVTGATSYNIYWSTTSGVTRSNGTKITNVPNPYTHSSLTNGTTYYYIATAVNSYGEGNASSQASATPSGTGGTAILSVNSSDPSSGVAITVSPNDKNGNGTGSTFFTRTYNTGTSVSLTAPGTATGGNTFSGWTNCDSTSGNTCTVTMSADKAVTANYTTPSPTPTLSVAKTGTGSGTVTSNPSGINCGSTCSYTYSPGASVTLTAAASSGSTFAGWSGDCSGTGTCVLTMSAAKSVTATFTLTSPIPGTATLSVNSSNPSSGVSITVSPNDKNGLGNGSTFFTRTYNTNTSVTLTAPATAGGNNFSGWTNCGSTSGNTCTVTMNADKAVTANYTTPSPTPTLTVAKTGTGSGTITSSPSGTINCGSTCSYTYSPGASVTLTAAASSGSTFAGWSGDCSGTGTCVLTMSAAKSVTATFTASTATLTGNGSQGTVSILPPSQGGHVDLAWNITGMTSCTASSNPSDPFWNGTKPVSGGPVTLTPSQSTTYSLSCSGPGGSGGVISLIVDVTEPYFTLQANPSSVPITFQKDKKDVCANVDITALDILGYNSKINLPISEVNWGGLIPKSSSFKPTSLDYSGGSKKYNTSTFSVCLPGSTVQNVYHVFVKGIGTDSYGKTDLVEILFNVMMASPTWKEI